MYDILCLWYKHIFYRLLDQSILNSFILYKAVNGEVKLHHTHGELWEFFGTTKQIVSEVNTEQNAVTQLTYYMAISVVLSDESVTKRSDRYLYRNTVQWALADKLVGVLSCYYHSLATKRKINLKVLIWLSVIFILVYF